MIVRGEEMTMTEIAKALGISRALVYEIYESALDKLSISPLRDFEDHEPFDQEHPFVDEDKYGRELHPREAEEMPPAWKSGIADFAAEGDDDAWCERVWRAYST